MRLLIASALALVACAVVTTASHQPSVAEHPCSGDFVFGDLNDDDVVTSVDAIMTLRVAAGFNVHSACGPFDVDCDHDIDAIDALKLLRYQAGLPYSQTEPCPNIG